MNRITLLISLLLPGLGRARQIAKRTVCASNIRHLAVASHLYTGDNRGSFVLAAEDIWGRNLRRWHGQRDSTNKPFDPNRSPLFPYMGNAGLKECPCFTADQDYTDVAGQGLGFESGCGGYGYNGVYVGARCDLYGIGDKAARQSARQEEVTSPGTTVMFTDCAYVTTLGRSTIKIAYSFCEPPFWQFSPGAPSDMRPDPTIDFRHLGQTNVAWIDGHAGPEDLTFTVSYQTHSLISGQEALKQGIGWFGPESNDLFDLY